MERSRGAVYLLRTGLRCISSHFSEVSTGRPAAGVWVTEQPMQLRSHELNKQILPSEGTDFSQGIPTPAFSLHSPRPAAFVSAYLDVYRRIRVGADVFPQLGLQCLASSDAARAEAGGRDSELEIETLWHQQRPSWAGTLVPEGTFLEKRRENVQLPSIDRQGPLEASSTKKKRRLKMNKHKQRKLRRRERHRNK